MIKKLTAFKNAYINHMTHRGKIGVHRVLVTQSDRALKDMGISKELLAGGVNNWPWTSPAEDGFSLGSASNSRIVAKPAATTAPRKTNRHKIAAAIRELNAFSDHQLRDLGIDRGMIKDAVVNGRYGIERKNPILGNTEKSVPNDIVIASTPTVSNVKVTQNSANDTDRPQPPMTPLNSGGGSRQAA